MFYFLMKWLIDVKSRSSLACITDSEAYKPISQPCLAFTAYDTSLMDIRLLKYQQWSARLIITYHQNEHYSLSLTSHPISKTITVYYSLPPSPRLLFFHATFPLHFCPFTWQRAGHHSLHLPDILSSSLEVGDIVEVGGVRWICWLWLT